MKSWYKFALTESDKHESRHRTGADLPEWVFSAASCLARKATAALLMPSANLMPADDMQTCQGLQYKLKAPTTIPCKSAVQFVPGLL